MSARRAALAPPQQDRSIATRQRLLDAAVEELLESGYKGFTTQGVARRAGVSRGGQQHHFPNKDVLIEEALRHLADRHLAQWQASATEGKTREARVGRILDLSYEQFSGPLFQAMLELALAARAEPRLRPIVSREERAISRAAIETVAEIFGIDADATVSERWALAFAMVRGVALLRTLRHPEASVSRQWTFTRRAAMDLLLDAAATPPGRA